MSSWSVFRQINKDAVTSPKSFEEPTFDPQDGLTNGKRKVRGKFDFRYFLNLTGSVSEILSLQLLNG